MADDKIDESPTPLASISDREALLRTIEDQPDEDTPRLVFADWEQEHGDEPRGELVRTQVELSRLNVTVPPEIPEPVEREFSLIELADAIEKRGGRYATQTIQLYEMGLDGPPTSITFPNFLRMHTDMLHDGYPADQLLTPDELATWLTERRETWQGNLIRDSLRDVKAARLAQDQTEYHQRVEERKRIIEEVAPRKAELEEKEEALLSEHSLDWIAEEYPDGIPEGEEVFFDRGVLRSQRVVSEPSAEAAEGAAGPAGDDAFDEDSMPIADEMDEAPGDDEDEEEDHAHAAEAPPPVWVQDLGWYARLGFPVALAGTYLVPHEYKAPPPLPARAPMVQKAPLDLMDHVLRLDPGIPLGAGNDGAGRPKPEDIRMHHLWSKSMSDPQGYLADAQVILRGLSCGLELMDYVSRHDGKNVAQMFEDAKKKLPHEPPELEEQLYAFSNALQNFALKQHIKDNERREILMCSADIGFMGTRLSALSSRPLKTPEGFEQRYAPYTLEGEKPVEGIHVESRLQSKRLKLTFGIHQEDAPKPSKFPRLLDAPIAGDDPPVIGNVFEDLIFPRFKPTKYLFSKELEIDLPEFSMGKFTNEKRITREITLGTHYKTGKPVTISLRYDRNISTYEFFEDIYRQMGFIAQHDPRALEQWPLKYVAPPPREVPPPEVTPKRIQGNEAPRLKVEGIPNHP